MTRSVSLAIVGVAAALYLAATLVVILFSANDGQAARRWS